MGFVTNSQLKQVEQTLVDNLKNEKLIPAKAVSAKTLDPVSEDSGVIQDEPFVIQGTGTANGTTSVDTGATAKQLEKRGNSVVVNQLVQNGNFSNGITNWTLAVGTANVSNNICEITSTGGNTYMYQGITQKVVGHKILLIFSAYSSINRGVAINWGDNLFNIALSTTKQTFINIATVGGGNQNLNFTFSNATNGEKEYLSNISLIDLTQWFNGDIPQDILDDPKRFFNYYGGSLAYNAGALTNATGRYLVNKHRNAWDEVWESGKINYLTGENEADSNRIRSKNYIPVIPNTIYYQQLPASAINNVFVFYGQNKNYISYANVNYNSTFTIPANCYYIRFYTRTEYGTTYSNNITISLYYSPDEGGADYDQYYPYEAPSVYDTGSEVLRSAGSVRDVKVPSGLITRKAKNIDLSTLSWTYQSTGDRFYSNIIDDIKAISSYTELPNISCNKYIANEFNTIYTGGKDKVIGVSDSKRIYIRDTSLNGNASLITGECNYELATPTEEEGTAFSPTIEIDDYGTNEWLKTYDATTPANNEYTAVPQACEIFYPADISLFIDTLGQRSDIGWNAENIVSQEQLDEVVNGARPVTEAKVAKNIKPYGDDSGALQENPYISQGTGTNNNLEIVTTGDYCEIKSKNGNTIPVMQLIDVRTTSATDNGITVEPTSKSGELYFHGTATGLSFIPCLSKTLNLIANHKYLFIGGLNKGDTCSYMISTVAQYFNNGRVYIPSTDITNQQLYFRAVEGSVIDAKSEPKFLDITSWDSDIITDLTTNPSHFSWYYNGDLSYGSRLINANGRYLECGQGRNLWDEESILGEINNSGEVVSGSRIVSKNFIQVVPNKPIYFFQENASADTDIKPFFYDVNKNFISVGLWSYYNPIQTPPSNCSFIKFHMASNYGTSYKKDTTISLYYTPEQGGEGYDQHYDYVAPKIIDTGNEELLAFDKKTPDGTIYHNTGDDDLTELNWAWQSDFSRWYSNDIADYVKKPSDNYTVANAKSSKYEVKSFTDANSTGVGLAISATGTLFVYTSDSVNTPTGHLQYELVDDHKTTSQGTSFQAYPDINDYSYMLWKDTDNNLVSVPQGASIFYPVNYAGFLDDVYARTDGDASDLVVQSEITDAALNARGYYKMQDLSAFFNQSIGGTLRQCLCVKETLTFNNTKVVDMGDLEYVYDSTYPAFRPTNLSDNAPVGERTHSIVLSTLYETVDAKYSSQLGNLSNMCMCQTLDSSGTNPNIWIKNTSYTDATAFKNAMKGVLLAYEKASS